jgi:hypothetical protein
MRRSFFVDEEDSCGDMHENTSMFQDNVSDELDECKPTAKPTNKFSMSASSLRIVSREDSYHSQESTNNTSKSSIENSIESQPHCVTTSPLNATMDNAFDRKVRHRQLI